jgi:hypothetical protein
LAILPWPETDRLLLIMEEGVVVVRVDLQELQQQAVQDQVV